MDAELRQRLARLDTACLCDASQNIHAMDAGIRLINHGPKLIGQAVTVACDSDFLSVLKALHEAKEGDVLVVSSQGERAMAGELFATEGLRRKLGGIVVDGAIRDTHSLAAIPLSVYARSAHPRAGTVDTVSRYHVLVQCGGVLIRPGDIVIGDAGGLVVTTLEEIHKTVPMAEKIQRNEARVLEGMRQGHSLFDYLNFDDHYEHCLHGHSSTLTFVLPEPSDTSPSAPTAS